MITMTKKSLMHQILLFVGYIRRCFLGMSGIGPPSTDPVRPGSLAGCPHCLHQVVPQVFPSINVSSVCGGRSLVACGGGTPCGSVVACGDAHYIFIIMYNLNQYISQSS